MKVDRISAKQMKSVLLPRRMPVAGPRPTSSSDLSTVTRVHRAAEATKILTRPRWLLFHITVGALAVTFVGLGRWQLGVSDAKHFDFFNFQYALQWWLFAAFGLFVWIRVVQHRLNPPQPGPARGGIVVRTGRAVAEGQGPTLLIAPGTTNDEHPVVYRGYVVPESSSVPVRSHGDALHDAYNDYLWQLGAADGATPDIRARPSTPPDGHSAEAASNSRPTGRELP